jgi:nitrogen regulatory protein PII
MKKVGVSLVVEDAKVDEVFDKVVSILDILAEHGLTVDGLVSVEDLYDTCPSVSMGYENVGGEAPDIILGSF